MLTDRFIPCKVVRCDENNARAARDHLADVGHGLFKQRRLGCKRYDQRPFLDQRNCPVLELTCGIGLRVDIRDLLELE